MNLQEIRQKYPEYDHADDQQLADALHKKYYDHAPKDVFYEKIGFNPDQAKAPQPQNGLQKVASLAEKYIDRGIGDPARALTAGIAQGLEHGAASLINLPLQALGAKSRIPYLDLAQHFSDEPRNKVAFYTGELGSSLIPGLKVAGAVSKGLKGAQSLKKLSPIAADALSGSIAGFSTGAHSEEGNMAERLFSSVLGGAIPTIANIAKPVIAKRIVAQQQKLGSALEKEYGDIFKSVEDRGLANKNLFTPKNALTLQRKVPTVAKDSIKDFIKNPTFKQAHNTQSDLGKVLRNLDANFIKRAKAGRPALSSEEKNYQAIEGLRNKIQAGMQNFLKENKSSDVGEAYLATSNKYAKEYSPYLEGSIKRYQAGDIKAAQLIKELQKITDKPFKGKNYSDIKGFDERKKFEPLINQLKKGAKYGLGFYGASKVLPYGFEEIIGNAASNID